MKYNKNKLFIKLSYNLSILILATLFFSCNNQKGKGDEVKIKQIVMTCNLKDNPQVIEKYKKYHSQDHVWPEVTEAARQSGYTSIKIYLFDTRLVMILTYPENLDFEEINKRYAESNPEKMKEWAEIMSGFQIAPPGADSSETWVEMEKIYEFTKKNNN